MRILNDLECTVVSGGDATSAAAPQQPVTYPNKLLPPGVGVVPMNPLNGPGGAGIFDVDDGYPPMFGTDGSVINSEDADQVSGVYYSAPAPTSGPNATAVTVS